MALTSEVLFASFQGRRRALISVFDRPDRAIVSPLADALFIYGSPILAFLLVHLALRLPFLNRDVTFGEPTTVIAFFLASLTFAHLLPVFLRSHINPTIRRRYRWRLLIVPPLLIGALTVSPAVYIVAGMVAAFWDVYHTAQQNFGFGRIYDARAGLSSTVNRRADRLMSHAMYLGPIIAGPSLVDHLSEIESLEDVGWSFLAAAPSKLNPAADRFRWLVVLAMAVAIVAYLVANIRYARRGVRSSPHKVMLLVVSAVIQIAAWGLSSPIVAFMVVNLYHAVQYFALVWHQEGRKTAGYLGLGRMPRLALPVGLLAVFAIPAAFGVAVDTVTTTSTFVNGAFLSVSLLHFWMDGFIWSVREKAI